MLNFRGGKVLGLINMNEKYIERVVKEVGILLVLGLVFLISRYLFGF